MKTGRERDGLESVIGVDERGRIEWREVGAHHDGTLLIVVGSLRR